MLNINYNTTQKITFNLAPSLVSPVYLFSLVNYTTRKRHNFIAAELSSGSNLLQFSITEVGEGVQDVLNGSISVESFGRHTLEIYEQTSTTSLDHEQASFLGEDALNAIKEVVFDAPPIRNDISVPQPVCTLTASVSVTDESAAGAMDGTASVTIGGLQGVASFAWSGPNGYTSTLQNITALHDGTYTVIVSDDFALGCTATDNGTVIEEPPAPSCNISITNQTVTAPTTQGGSDGIIDITVTGNVGSITYRHDNVIGSNPQGGFSQGDVVVTTADSSVLGCAAGVNVFMPSHYGNYLIFDGRTESVEFDSRISVANAQNYTVATHVRALHDDFTVMVSGSSTKNRCYMIPNLNQIFIRENSNYLVFDFPSIVKDTWYYVVWGRESNFTRCWIDGVESTSGAIAMSGTGATNFERLGAYSSTFYPLHQDNFGIKVGVEPASHVVALTADPTTFDTEMSGSDVMFRFNELPASLEAIDESANNNNGTLSGFLANADPANRQPHV